MKLRREKSFLLWAGVCALAVFAPACGSDGDGDGSKVQCPAEQLTEGAYAFSLGKVVDDCDGDDVDVGNLIRLIDPGPYGPFALPSFVQLQQGPVLKDVQLPVLGTVQVQISLNGDVIRLTLPGTVDVLILPGCTATLRAEGTLCPVSASQVNATLEITLEAVLGDGCGVIPLFTPCSATVNLGGV